MIIKKKIKFKNQPKIMKNILSLAVLLFSLAFFVSCQKEEEDSINNQDESLENFNLDNIEFEFTARMFQTTYNLTQIDLSTIIETTVNDLYSEELNEHEFLAINFLIKGELVTITPITGPVNPTPHGDDEDCGGQSGDGWELFDTCYTENCAKQATATAASELAESLENGKCIDIRIKKNRANVKVCGRLIDC